MAAIRVTQIAFDEIGINEDANDRTSQINFEGITNNGDSFDRTTQIVFLGITAPAGGVFRELFMPLTSTDE